MKDLILITSHCDTEDKEKILLDLVVDLQRFKVDYDIMISSHTPINHEIHGLVDYVLYNRNNELLVGPNYVNKHWFSHIENRVIQSSYAYVNTHAAILSILIPAISYAKSLGYEKVHQIEYDTTITSDKEFKLNSHFLNEYDYIIYSHPKYDMEGSFKSFKISKIIEEWKRFDMGVIENLYKNDTKKITENVVANLIKTQRNVLIKDINVLEYNGLMISQIRGNSVYFDVPFFDTIDFKLKFITKNLQDFKYNIKVFVNDKLKVNYNCHPGYWKIFDLLDDFYEVFSIEVVRNNKRVFKLHFDDLKSKENFKENSLLLIVDSLENFH